MSKIVKFKSKRKRANPARDIDLRSNPPLGVDIVEYIGPGFAAFAATRLLTRIAAVQIAKRYPRWGRHAGAIASVGAFGAAWFGAHRVKYLEKYHHPIVVGSGIAAIQSLMQLYLPALGWMVSDATPEMKQVAATPKSASQVAKAVPAIAPPAPQDLPEGFSEVDEASWYAYNDAFSPGAYAGKQAPDSPLQSVAVDSASPDEVSISDLLDNSDLNLEDN